MSLLLDNIQLPANAAHHIGLSLVQEAQHTHDKLKTEKIAVIGLGYVGLPLATHLAEQFRYVVGLDINTDRVEALRSGIDRTNEVDAQQLTSSGLRVTDRISELSGATFFIITVPTPITKAHQPDLSPLKAACKAIGPLLKKGDMVVLESTVYPGVTEDVCGPILEQFSGLDAGRDFSLGYSPERINPGDKTNTLDRIVKVISADSASALDRVANVYGEIIRAGLYRSPSIKVAEGAKVLENTQRDVNIALMNEVSKIFDSAGIATQDVINAAATKWNFVPFTPGLVGGHCIGVDPYYLAHFAQSVGADPQMILSGRQTNDGMVKHVKEAVLSMLITGRSIPQNAKVGLFGITFKENVPDVRNSKSIELVHDLKKLGLNLFVHDAHCTRLSAEHEQIELSQAAQMRDLDVMVVSCPHDAYLDQPGFLDQLKPDGALIDLKGAFRDRDLGGRRYWTL